MAAGRGRGTWAAAVAAIGLAAAVAQAAGLFEGPELALFDLRAAVRLTVGPPSEAAHRVAVVAVDDPSLARLGRWPWPRDVHARLLRRLAQARPAAVGLDLVLSEPGDEAGDRELARAARLLPVVVPSGDEAPYPALREAASAAGSIRFALDPDGRVRRLAADAGGGGVSFAAALVWAAGAAGRAGGSGPVGPEPGEVRWLDFRRPPASLWPLSVEGLFDTYSYAAVLAGEVPPEALAGRIVIVGVTAPGVAGADRHLVGVEALGPVPGVYLHADAVRVLLEPRPLRRADRLGPLLALGLAAAAGLAGWGAPAVLLVLYAAVNVGLFVWGGLWLELAGPAFTLGAVQAGWVLRRIVEERRRRQHVEALFGRYVSPAVLGELLRAPSLPHPGGVRQEVSVVMADLCGFTALAEATAPEDVVQTLNAYLEAMARPVLEAGGMLDKYLGDGLLAVFGAPLPQADHARRALGCAAAILRGVQALNRRRRRLGLPALEVRVAVHTGEAVLGNVGTRDRMDYTAVGDTVNVCSRLQEQAGPGEALVTRAAASAAGLDGPDGAGPVALPGMVARGPERLRLRGRAAPVEVWRIAPPQPSAASRARALGDV